ncbi:MAG TPA: glycerophosphodiester phosphodiesterase family protein, partial [bacterium]|nr:glycerophosphodiester phosphodiesterase family protein [bacterium]
HWRALNKLIVYNLHRRGLTVNAWTPDTRKQLQKTLRYGVDAVTTNFPDRIKQILSIGNRHEQRFSPGGGRGFKRRG